MSSIEYSGRDNLEAMREAENYNRFLLELVLKSARKERLIVDFGAGAGTFAVPLMKAGYRVTCVETDQMLRGQLERAGLHVSENLNLVSDESVDYIYSLNVLEHIDEDQAMLRLWFSKLSPGGRLLVYVPAFPRLFSSMDEKVGHRRRYRIVDLSAKLRGVGFRLDRVRYADSLGFFATLIYQCLGSQQGTIDLRWLRTYDRIAFPVSKTLDRLCGTVFGKNVYAIAMKP